MRSCWVLGTTLLVTMAGTGSPQQVRDHHVIRSEIGGVPLIRTEGGPKYDGPLFEILPDLVLGLDEGEPEWQVFWASPAILAAPDGRMVLIDFRRCEIFIASTAGELLARVGGPGSGPGEFRQPWFEHWDIPGEVFLIDDRALNRMTRFSMTGELLETLNYGLIQNRKWQAFTSLGSGRYLGYRRDSEGSSVVGQPIKSVTSYHFLDSHLVLVADFIELHHRTNFATSEHSFSPIPFTRRSDLLTFPDGRMLLVDQEQGRMTVYTTTGEPVLHIERDWERSRLSARDREEARKRFSENEMAYMRRIANRIPFPSRYAAFSTAFTDDRGRIWVDYVTGPSPTSVLADHFRYDVFGPDGVWLGVQEFDFHPTLIQGDYVYHRGPLFGAEAPRLYRFHLRPRIPEAAGRIR